VQEWREVAAADRRGEHEEAAEDDGVSPEREQREAVAAALRGDGAIGGGAMGSDTAAGSAGAR
jgi:hypothetical protein